MSDKGWHVVSFSQEKGKMEIVPSSWLISGNYCLWPPFQKSSQIINAIQNQLPPMKIGKMLK